MTFRPRVDRDIAVRLRGRASRWPGHPGALPGSLSVSDCAVLVCDMWDDHWCPAAARRVGEMVPRMDAVLTAARAMGFQIIHAPSETMDFYADTVHRRRALSVPAVPERPRGADALADPPLPIDDGDGGCDSPGAPRPFRAWTRQHPGLQIAGHDAVSDDGAEVSGLLAHLGIGHLFVMGVHTNMCVLNRSFAIRAMTHRGIRCILVRDLTDAMYNPLRPPHVTHAEGTDLVVRYIEEHYCPSVTSEQFLA